MARRKQETESIGDGHDSFLDIVANMVGILIILVMVVSVRAKDAPQPTDEQIATPTTPVSVTTPETPETPAPTETPESPESPESPQQPIIDLTEPLDKIATIQSDVLGTAVEVRKLDGLLAARINERNAMATLVAAGEKELADRREALSENERAAFDLQRQLAAERERLDKIELERIHAASVEPDVVEIENLPTPLSKTVLGDEVIFQLKGKRLAHIPLEPLVEDARGKLRHKLWKLDGLPEVTEVVGPMGGFRLRYTIEKFRERVAPGDDRIVVGIRAKRWELLPVDGQLGEPVEEAFAPGSNFRRVLSGIDPQRDTITIVTYPDSFDEFRRLKKELYRLGFAVAGRPLPEGSLIAGSPYGSQSAAQ